MRDTVLEKWQSSSPYAHASVVIPDGCRDLIFRSSPGLPPGWYVTGLDDAAYSVNIAAGACLEGYRLRPGTSIAIGMLLNSLRFMDGQGGIADRIGSFTKLDPNVAEALDCLGSTIQTVRGAAAQLGVSTRSLQRLLQKATNRSPAAWISLARARKAARLAAGAGNLAQTAFDCGYADQAHMSREFRRWFDISPARLRKENGVISQLDHRGYF